MKLTPEQEAFGRKMRAMDELQNRVRALVPQDADPALAFDLGVGIWKLRLAVLDRRPDQFEITSALADVHTRLRRIDGMESVVELVGEGCWLPQ